MKYLISIKDEVVFDNLFEVAWHPILVDVFQWIIYSGVEPCPNITSAYRPCDTGVHGTDPLRGFDISGKGDPAIEKTRLINEHWQYDPKRPDKLVAIYHDVGKGFHIHVQVHPNTIKINGGWGNIDEAKRLHRR